MVLSIREPSLPYISHGKFGFFTGYIFTINLVIGAGFLSIPWAYENSGWLFSLLFQIFVSVQMYIVSSQLLESLSRSEILLRMTEEGKDIHSISLQKLFTKPLLQEKLIQPPHLTPMITQREISCPDDKASFWRSYRHDIFNIYVFIHDRNDDSLLLYFCEFFCF